MKQYGDFCLSVNDLANWDLHLPGGRTAPIADPVLAVYGPGPQYVAGVYAESASIGEN